MSNRSGYFWRYSQTEKRKAWRREYGKTYRLTEKSQAYQKEYQAEYAKKWKVKRVRIRETKVVPTMNIDYRYKWETCKEATALVLSFLKRWKILSSPLQWTEPVSVLELQSAPGGVLASFEGCTRISPTLDRNGFLNLLNNISRAVDRTYEEYRLGHAKGRPLKKI